MPVKIVTFLTCLLLLLIAREVAPRKLQQAPASSLVVPRTYIVQITDVNVAAAAFSGASRAQPETTAAADPPSAVLQGVHAADLDVKQISSFNSDIFKGVVVKAASDEAAAALLQHLTDDGRVASIFPVVSSCCQCFYYIQQPVATAIG
jgi:hypothetical protein